MPADPVPVSAICVLWDRVGDRKAVGTVGNRPLRMRWVSVPDVGTILPDGPEGTVRKRTIQEDGPYTKDRTVQYHGGGKPPPYRWVG